MSVMVTFRHQRTASSRHVGPFDFVQVTGDQLFGAGENGEVRIAEYSRDDSCWDCPDGSYWTDFVVRPRALNE